MSLALSVLGWLVKTIARPFLYIMYGMERQRRKQAEKTLSDAQKVKKARDALLDPERRKLLRRRFK